MQHACLIVVAVAVAVVVVVATRSRMYDNDVGDRATLAMVNYELQLQLQLQLCRAWQPKNQELRTTNARVEEPFDWLHKHDLKTLHGQS